MMGGLMTAASKKEGWINNGERPGGEKFECRRLRYNIRFSYSVA